MELFLICDLTNIVGHLECLSEINGFPIKDGLSNHHLSQCIRISSSFLPLLVVVLQLLLLKLPEELMLQVSLLQLLASVQLSQQVLLISKQILVFLLELVTLFPLLLSHANPYHLFYLLEAKTMAFLKLS